MEINYFQRILFAVDAGLIDWKFKYGFDLDFIIDACEARKTNLR